MPVSDDGLVALVRDRLPAGQTIGVALSGGGDSTALLHLCLAAGFAVEAVTVDHRLRAESAAEAAEVGRWCAALGVPHQVLEWTHGAVAGNLMEAAGEARRTLIRDWAAARGIGVVALGHTRDDVAETVLMGLARAAGLAGLSGLRPDWEEVGLRFLRPLLPVGRAELRDWLRAKGIGWIDDPTNDNDRFNRVKARRALVALAPLGLTAERLAAVAGHLARVQEALDWELRAVTQRLVHETAGALRFDAGLFALPGELRLPVVQAGLQWLTGTRHAPRRAGIERIVEALAEGQDATLAGCRARRGWLMREPRALGPAVPVGQVWDGRWRVIGPPGEVRALGAEGLRQLPDWRATGLPREVLVATPGIWRADALLGAPLAGAPGDWRAQIQQPFTFSR